MSSEVASPCCGICHIDQPTQVCDGCLRTLDEIARWSSMDNEQKRDVLEACRQRQGLNSGGGIE